MLPLRTAFRFAIRLPVKVASSEPFEMANVGLCWDEFRMVKVPDALEIQPPPYVSYMEMKARLKAAGVPQSELFGASNKAALLRRDKKRHNARDLSKVNEAAS